jgi:hypothetical protein
MLYLALTAVLAAVFSRVFRRRGRLSDMRNAALLRHARLLREVRENGELSGRESLRPLLASLDDLRLPPGTSLAVSEGPDGARVAVSRPGGGFCLLLGHSLRPGEDKGGSAPGERWILRVEGGRHAPGGAEPEYFYDLAACAGRVRDLITAASRRPPPRRKPGGG